MKFVLAFLVAWTMAEGCQQRVISGKELESKLKETMKEYLDTTLQPGVTVTINDVAFYPDKIEKLYYCQFNVNMHFQNKDTTGVVVATITNDFNKVERTQ